MRRDTLRFSRPTLAGVFVALLVPIGAAAQPPARPTDLPRFDVTGSIVWFGGDVGDLPGEIYQSWESTGAGELGLGFYWTEHVKLAVDGGASGERELFGVVQQYATSSSARYIYTRHSVRTRWLTTTAQYQFLHNTWVHPYAGGGLEVDWERRRTESESQTYVHTYPTSTSTTETSGEAIARTTRVAGVLFMGAKFYVSPRVFLRTDLRGTFTDRVNSVRWAAGGGVDF